MNKHVAKEKGMKLLHPIPSSIKALTRRQGYKLHEQGLYRKTVINMPLRYIIILGLSTLFLDTWVFLAKTGILLMKISPLLLSGDFLARSWRGGRVYR